MAMKKFEPVQRGWAGNADAAQEEKARWKTVMAQVPEHRKKMATILLSDPRAAGGYDRGRALAKKARPLRPGSLSGYGAGIPFRPGALCRRC